MNPLNPYGYLLSEQIEGATVCDVQDVVLHTYNEAQALGAHPYAIEPFGGLENATSSELENRKLYFQYNGTWYNLQEFEDAPQSLRSRGWYGYTADNYDKTIVTDIRNSDGRYSVPFGTVRIKVAELRSAI